MNRYACTAAVVVVVLGVALAAHHLVVAAEPATAKEPGVPLAKGAEEVRTIQSEGTASVRVKPDRARLYFKVMTQAETIKEARSANGTQTKKSMQAIQDLKIADLKMKSSDIEVDPIYAINDKGEKLAKVLGYRVTHTFTTLLSNNDSEKLAADAARVFDVALENGTNEVGGIAFFKEDTVASKREALTKATEEALANCRALAKGAERTVIDVVEIRDVGRSDYSPGNNIQQGGGRVRGDDDSTSLAASELVIVARVNVICRLSSGK